MAITRNSNREGIWRKAKIEERWLITEEARNARVVVWADRESEEISQRACDLSG